MKGDRKTSDYSSAVRKSLKLKKDSKDTVRRKKPHRQSELSAEAEKSVATSQKVPTTDEVSLDAASNSVDLVAGSTDAGVDIASEWGLTTGPADHLTPAERAFRLAQKRREKERIGNKLAVTHRDRMEKFNAHLATLSEHFDIPKVGPG